MACIASVNTVRCCWSAGASWPGGSWSEGGYHRHPFPTGQHQDQLRCLKKEKHITITIHVCRTTSFCKYTHSSPTTLILIMNLGGIFEWLFCRENELIRVALVTRCDKLKTLKYRLIYDIFQTLSAPRAVKYRRRRLYNPPSDQKARVAFERNNLWTSSATKPDARRYGPALNLLNC